MTRWTEDQVVEYFDSNWDCTLAELSALSGYSVKELKVILITLT